MTSDDPPTKAELQLAKERIAKRLEAQLKEEQKRAADRKEFPPRSGNLK